MKIIIALERVAELHRPEVLEPIFQLADYGLVADPFQAVPVLVDSLQQRRG